MTDGYSLRQIKTDGVLTAPRWMHHLIKIMTSLSAFVGLLVVGLSVIVASLAASLGLFALVWVHERVRPSDVAPRSTWDHVADALTDGACACVTLAAGFALVDAWTTGLLIFVACAAAYGVGHEHARP
jgi:hypothetical protein